MRTLACQENLLPGDDLMAKWEAARAYGFDALELRGQGHHRIRDRLPELRAARAAGVPMPTVCVEMDHFIGDFDAERRADAVANMRTMLSVVAELGGTGAVTPASYGMFSRRLPPFEPPRDPAGDRAVLLDALGELGRHAAAEGVSVHLEPLNRYEDHMVNTLAQAVELAEATGVDAVRVCADAFHMSIEEADVEASVRAAAGRLGHVQVSDTNRLEPGAGHLDWPGLLATLDAVGYSGPLAFECRLSGPPEVALPRAVAVLRAAGAGRERAQSASVP